MKIPLIIAASCGCLMSHGRADVPESAPAVGSQTSSKPEAELAALPDFHESWTDDERAVLKRFADYIKEFPLPEVYKNGFHQVITTGRCEKHLSNGDLLARIAAMYDDFEAMCLFIERGEDANTPALKMNDESLCDLAAEVIWSKNLGLNTPITHTAAQRVEKLEWLRSKGFKPAEHAEVIMFALGISCRVESQDISPLIEWCLRELPLQGDGSETEVTFIESVLQATGGSHIVKRLIENGILKVNEPLGDYLPLQHICQWELGSKSVNLETLQVLLESGADPELIVVDEEEGDDSVEYNQDDYEEEDAPNQELDAFASAAEMLCEIILYSEDNNHSTTRLVALDLLLLYGAKPEIPEIDDDTPDEIENKLRDITKRLKMSKKELQEDLQGLREKLNKQ